MLTYIASPSRRLTLHRITSGDLDVPDQLLAGMAYQIELLNSLRACRVGAAEATVTPLVDANTRSGSDIGTIIVVERAAVRHVVRRQNRAAATEVVEIRVLRAGPNVDETVAVVLVWFEDRERFACVNDRVLVCTGGNPVKRIECVALPQIVNIEETVGEASPAGDSP